MGDENTLLSEPEARHLLRRATFDGSPTGLRKSGIEGLTRGEAAAHLLGRRPVRFRPGGRYIERVHGKWLQYMIRSRAQLQSKLVLFWHDHFATAYSKVGDVKLMSNHVKTLYTHALGDLRVFVKAIGKDPAMIEFLDTARNRKYVPNENYARELLELFTVGVNDLAGSPNYEQEDILQIARAFTGWSYDRYKPDFRSYLHDFSVDYPERGPKTIFVDAHGFGPAGGSLTSAGEGEAEIDTVIDVLFQHVDSEGRNTIARRIAYRLLEYYAYAEPETSVVDAIVADSGFDQSFDVTALLGALFTHDAFYAAAQPTPFPPDTRKSVKWPAHYLVSTCRMLNMKLRGSEFYIDGGSYSSAHEHMANMGQTLLDPPSVFGWEWENSWISTSTLLARFLMARDLVAARDGFKRFRPERLMDLELTDPSAIVDAVTDLLDVAHQLTSAERDALIDYLSDGGVVPSIDLLDEQVRNTKLHGLFALVMQCPAYQVQ